MPRSLNLYTTVLITAERLDKRAVISLTITNADLRRGHAGKGQLNEDLYKYAGKGQLNEDLYKY